MTVRADGQWVRLEGDCPVEEAETLAGLLRQGGWSGVDLSECRVAHSAVVQALIAFRSPVTGGGASPFVQSFIAPALMAALAKGAERQDAGEPLEEVSEDGAQAPSS